MNNLIIYVPIIFVLYVVLNFFAANPFLISIKSFADAFIMVSFIAITIQVVSWVYLRDKTRAGIATTFFMLTFFSFAILEQTALSFVSVSKINRDLGLVSFFVLIVILLGLVYYGLKRDKSELSLLSTFLVLFVGVLPIMPVMTITNYNWQLHNLISLDSENAEQIQQPIGKQLPDIYHIILDGYGREDVLRNNYDYDNAEYIAGLQSLGFTVRDDCHTNYIWTAFSVASMLSLDYVPQMNVDSEIAKQMLARRLEEYGVGNLLGQAGYDYYEISSPVPTTKASDFMNIYKTNSSVSKYILYGTPLKYCYGPMSAAGDNEIYNFWRSDIIRRLDIISNLPSNANRPLFAYCHICMPHPPFVFDALGNPVNPPRPFSFNDCNDWIAQEDAEDEYRKYYPQQLAFTNTIIKETVNDIILKSQKPTLIIISSDHGPRVLIDQTSLEKSQCHEAIPIFLAYKLPKGDNLNLDDVKSPVNLYRMILNHYCETNYPLLEERLYYTNWPGKLKNYDISYRLQGLP